MAYKPAMKALFVLPAVLLFSALMLPSDAVFAQTVSPQPAETVDATITLSGGGVGDFTRVTVERGGSQIGSVTLSGDIWTIPDVVLIPGRNELVVKFVTSSGSVPATVRVRIRFVNAVPAAPVITQPTSPTTNTADITISGTAETDSTVTLTLNGNALPLTVATGGAWSISGVTLTDGVNMFTATAENLKGTSGPAEITVRLVTMVPAAPIITQPTSPTNMADITISGTAEGDSTVTLTLNGDALPPTTVATGGAWSISGVTLTDGVNVFIATAENLIGTSDSSVAITIGADALNKDAVAQLHNKILSRATQVVVANTNRAVEGRIDVAFSGAPQVASYTLDGQTVPLDGQLSAGLRGAMMNKLPTYAKSWQDGTLDWKQMLSRSSFVLPLNATGGDGAGNAGLTVWGSGDYTNMSGKEANLDWDGNVTGFQLGIDGRRDDVLTGGLVSFSKGSANYTQDNTKGTYEHKMTSIHPYMVWSNEGVNLWGSAGYGRGRVEIDRDGDKGNAKTTMLSLSGGVKRKLAPQGMSLKGDISLARTAVGALTGDVQADEETVKSQQFRLILESTRQRTLESGGTVTPVLEAGLRYDGGSGESGIGAILGAGIRFNDAVTGLTVEGKVHALLGRKDYTEWGVSGVIRQQARADERGLSFSLSPSYGNTDSKAEKLWDQALPVGDSDNTDDYDMLRPLHDLKCGQKWG